MAPGDAVEQLIAAAAAVSTLAQPVTLVIGLTVPHDQTLFGVFRAATVDAVIQPANAPAGPPTGSAHDVHPLAHLRAALTRATVVTGRPP